MNWTCPHCDRAQTVTDVNFHTSVHFLQVPETALGHLGLRLQCIRCANDICNQPTIVAALRSFEVFANGHRHHDPSADSISTFNLMPESSAKPQPDLIPAAIREDYTEACRIRDLSPKASATLSRRCLQGMIRDFAGVSENTLYREIEKLKELAERGDLPKGVSEDSIDGLHHLRSLGNIGAHMEKDIDLIIPVDPEEAQIMIELLETLFEEWYIARAKRESKFEKLRLAAEEKQALRELPKPEQS